MNSAGFLHTNLLERKLTSGFFAKFNLINLDASTFNQVMSYNYKNQDNWISSYFMIASFYIRLDRIIVFDQKKKNENPILFLAD